MPVQGTRFRRTGRRAPCAVWNRVIEASIIPDITRARRLHPASGNDRGPLLSSLELVACSGVQLAQIVGTLVGQRVSLEPRLQVFDGVKVGA
jgi:hypothetical protein